MFLGPCLTGVHFAFRSGNPLVQISLLPMLCDKYPSLKQVSFTYRDPTNYIENIHGIRAITTKSIGKWQNLESLTIPNISYSALQNISLLPSMKHLSIVRWQPDIIVRSPQQRGFKELKYLQVSGINNANDCISLMELMDSSPVEEIRLIFQVVEDVTCWRKVLAAVSEHCDRDTVKCVHCMDGFSMRRDNVSFPIPRKNMLNYEAVKPLLIFHNLQTLYFEVFRGFHVSEPEATMEMAANWTKIKTLMFKLPVWRRSQRPSSITLLDLLPFAKYCPDLKKLAIFLDAMNPPDIDDKENQGTVYLRRHLLSSMSVILQLEPQFKSQRSSQAVLLPYSK
ncbi:hypothetical protein BDQ17DRAFT_621603 [Cyathus striatus]|nr:hypothetical protein BDQ17DRAFT_621603 [Cyathus striatus]